jgi:hypothetical protein
LNYKEIAGKNWKREMAIGSQELRTLTGWEQQHPHRFPDFQKLDSPTEMETQLYASGFHAKPFHAKTASGYCAVSGTHGCRIF